MEETRFGEVVEAGTTEFLAQCYELYKSPPLGGLVKTRSQGIEIFGVVYHVATTSLEPGRRPIARGKDETNEEEIYRSSPQLLKLLKSECNILVAGHSEGDSMRHYLPPDPARIHGFVYLCSPEEVRRFSSSFNFLDILINARLSIPTDEFTAAALRQMSQAHEDRHAFLVAAGKEVAARLSGQFNQVKAVLGRLK